MKHKVAIAIVALSLCGGTISPRSWDSDHVEFAKRMPHVLRINCEDRAFAACVVLSPEYVITAAHVIDGDTWWTVDDGRGKTRNVVSASVHATADIAVCLVDEPFSYKTYVDIYKDDDELGKVASVAGFGMTGDFLSGYVKEQDGKLRGGQACIREIWDKTVLACPVDPTIPLAYCISPGDSGGGLFIGGKLAGINSEVTRVGGKGAAYGCHSLHVRLSVEREWILSEISSSR